MKKLSLLSLALLASFVLSFSSVANAAVYNFVSTDDNAEMGTIVFGDSGTIQTNTVNNHDFDTASGSLGVGTGIELTYTLNPTTGFNTSVDVSPYVNGTPVTPVSVFPDQFVGPDPIQLGYSFASGVSETFIRQISLTEFVVSIANLSANNPLSFSSLLGITGNFSRDGDVTTTFSTFATQVSNVPLPAALPLFGLGLAGLAGYRRLKKGTKAV